MNSKKVFVSGCYDMLHSGHVAFFKEASSYGDLYVGIGSDKTIEELKNRKTVCSEKERLYMVKAIRYVKGAFINPGSGMLDFAELIDKIKPDIFVVNEDGGSDLKRSFCKEKGIEYIELNRIPDEGLEARSTTSLRNNVKSQLPYRLDLAGTWIDQPYVSKFGSGWAITISLEPTIDFMERAGMSTSTRNAAKKIWPYQLPNSNSEILAKLLFCFENEPEKKGHISGAQDAIGICIPGLCRHFYNNNYWPSKIEQCKNEDVLCWLEEHICLIPMFPRPNGYSVLENSNINESDVIKLSKAAYSCWNAIIKKDLQGFAKAYSDSFEAQVNMFPNMMAEGVQDFINKYKDIALSYKMSGAGGGGYLALVCENNFPEEGIRIKIRRD